MKKARTVCKPSSPGSVLLTSHRDQTDMKMISVSSATSSSFVSSLEKPGTPRPASLTGSLGIYAKSASTLPPEVVPAVQVDPLAARAKRWGLKAVVNGLLPKTRTAKCMKWRVPAQQLGVLKGKTSAKCFYTGLQVCSSVWACPICAAKISERRRVELLKAMGVAKLLGFQVFLLTLTVPHGLGDRLADTMDKLGKAMKLFGSGRAAATWRKSIGLEGTIRALEITHGANGWHPHFHILVFVSGKVPRLEMQASASVLWQKAAVKAGLPAPHPIYGCDLTDGSWAARYASKWGLESEMTKSHLKTTKGDKGSSVWGLLAEVRDTGDKKAAARFVEFATVFKGQRQLCWSRGLKDLLKVGEKTDEELAKEVQEEADLLTLMTNEQWRAVYRLKKEAEFLALCEKCPDSAWDYLEYTLAEYIETQGVDSSPKIS